MILEILRMSFLNVTYNKMRSFLTILGVLIGVSSIIALTSIVQGVTDNVTNSVLSMGATTVTVNIQGNKVQSGLFEDDLDLFTDISNVTGVNPTVSSRVYADYNRNRIDSVTITGASNTYFEEDDELLSYGRELNYLDVESRNNVVVIGSEIVEDLFYGVTPLGKTIKLGGISYEVVGVLEPVSGFSTTSNSTIIMPYTTAMDDFGVNLINSVQVYIDDENLLNETTENVEDVLLEFFDDEDAYSIINLDSIIDTVKEMTGTMSMMLAGIAGISLLVGGIGIMNMMLVTVTERTREIGLRKSLGATPFVIQMQFILEALFLSILGGIAGLIVGALTAYLGTSLLQVDFVLVSYAVPLALGFSSFVGLIFGFMPAKKASELNPMDALRSV